MTNAAVGSTLYEYLNVQGAYQPTVIPNQNAVTYISKETVIPQVWKWDGATSQIKQYTDLKDRVLSVNHSPLGDKTIVGIDHKGNEKQQMYLLDNDGANVEELVVSDEHFHQFGGWSPDGTKIAFSSNRRHPGYFDVYVLDVKTKKEKKAYQVDGNCTSLCWTKDGRNLILSTPETNIDQSLHVLNLETQETYRLGAEQTLARYQSLDLTKDGKGGFLLSDVGQDTLGVFEFTFAAPSKLQNVLTVEGWDIEEVKLSPDEEKIAYTVNKGGVSKLGIYNRTTGTYDYVKGLPSGVFQSVSWYEQDLFFHVKSAVIPGDVWKMNSDNKKLERITYVGEAKDVQHLWLDPVLSSFTSFDGLEVPYFFYGNEEKAQPVVVYVHGGPEHQIRHEFNPVIQYLAANGFAVVTPNVRGSMGYGRKYVKLDDGRKRMDSVADLKWLVKDLVENERADPDKVGIMGRSYGGFMVLAALTHYPDIWATGVDIVGISHFKTFLENTGSWRRELREFEYGSLKKDTDFFEQIAPLNRTNKIKAPLLIFHGRNDTRVPVNEAEQLTADLENQGKQVELIIFDDEGHQTEKIENHIHMNTKIVQFMQKFL